MASRVMHLAIAEEIMKQVSINDVNRFRLGIILPDAYNRNIQTANNSHLKYTTANGTKKTYKLDWFRKTYAQQLKTDDLYLGYYLHLIQDTIFRYFVYSLHNWNPYPKGNTERLHNDYKLLNNYVIDRYKLPDNLIIPDRIKEEPIFDIYPFDTEQLSIDFKSDFISYNNGYAFFFTEEMTDEFIKMASEKCIEEIMALNNGKSVIDESEWAWDTPQRSKSITEARNWWRPRITIEKLLFNNITL